MELSRFFSQYLACSAGFVVLVLGSDAVWARSDLTPIEFTSDLASGTPGTGVHLSYTVANDDLTPSIGSYTGFWFSDDTNCATDADNTYLTQSQVPVLGSGQTFSDTVLVSIPNDATLGPARLCLVADYTDLVVESSESNNEMSTAFAIDPIRPDLVLSAFTFSPVQGPVGTVVNLNITVSNQGDASTGDSFSVRFYTSVDGNYDSWDDILIRSILLPSLDSGVSISRSLSATIPAESPAGPGFILALVDPQEFILESDESNNLASGPFLVVVDLIFEAGFETGDTLDGR
jgi:hypothetical protein